MRIAAETAVLVVDDDASKRLALTAALRPLGYTIVEADSGRAALRRLIEQDFAVILLDVCMPEMDGFETAVLIRQRTQSEMTPIIFITAFASDELQQTKQYATGAVDFIYSPVPAEELRAKVSVFAGLFARFEELAAGSREVQASADHLRLVTDAAPIGIFQTDAQGRYVYTNPHWSQITGVSAEAAAGLKRDAVLGTALAADPADPGSRFEVRDADDAPHILQLIAGRVQDTGGWVGTLSDITAEAGAEASLSAARDAANEASRMKSAFLATMSHEIRTPMNGVIGMTDLLLETGLDTRQRDYAQTVRKSGESLLTIIDDILDFSKIEVGMLEVEAVEFELRTVIEDVAHLLAGPAHAKGLELIVAIESSVPPFVVGDPGRVRQVLMNLIGNAIKFTQSGEVVVRAAAYETDHQATVRFEISDTGDGIAADKLDIVLEPFAQADSSTSRKYGGTGLGLAISRQLVDLMGGECGVSSEVGVGSEFWFTIRVPYREAPTLTGGRSPDELVGVRVLVADASATQRSVLSGYLNEWGLEVSVAESGDAAQTAVSAAMDAGRPFDVVLATQAIATALPAPLVTMTTQEDSDVRAHACVAKPVRRRELLLSLRQALGFERAPTPARPDAEASLPAARGRLLVAEDNAINRKVAVAMLSGAGYDVETVVDGAAAVEALRKGPYDAVLMDCHMPELDGYEATAIIRAEEGATRHTPIIAVTAGALPQDRQRALAEGMDSYLAKPIGKEALLALVANAVSADTADATGYGPTIDPLVFEELRSVGASEHSDLLRDLIEDFERESEPCLVELREAMDRCDSSAVAFQAHRMRGSCLQLGARRLAASCERLERKAAAGYLTPTRIDLEDVEVDYEDLRRVLAKELERLHDLQPS
jgi:PAS domain S-box-containing protein